MHTLNINPYELPKTSRIALALVSSVLTGLIATSLLQWNTVRATVAAPEEFLTRVTDTDGDGLVDLEELPYGTSIYNADSDGDGMSNGEEAAQGRNPSGEGMRAVRTRMHQGGDRDHDGLGDREELRAWGTDPDNADTDGDGFPDGLETENGFDPSGPGRPNVTIAIPSIRVKAPIVWTETADEKTIAQDLERGVIHFPGTAVPGETGSAFITGHSSDYIWQKGAYRDIFKDLPKLSKGDTVIFIFSYANGKVREVKYILHEKLLVSPADRGLLSPAPDATLTLVTCYPIGSNAKRLAWRGILVQ